MKHKHNLMPLSAKLNQVTLIQTCRSGNHWCNINISLTKKYLQSMIIIDYSPHCYKRLMKDNLKWQLRLQLLMILIIFGMMMSTKTTIHKEAIVKIMRVKEQRSLKISIKPPKK